MALPAQNYMSNNGRTEGEMKVALEDQRDAVASTPGGAASVELTIAAGVVTPTVTAGDFRIDTEADAASDDLTNALQTSAWESRRIRFRCENAARVTTVKHGAGGGGQFLTVDGLDFVLSATDRWIEFEDVGSDWVERSRSYGADYLAAQDHLRIAAVPAHNTLCPHSRLRIDYASVATLSVAADAVVLADSSGRLKRFSGLSETLNVANTGANGRDAVDNGGAEQASVWYHLWAIGKSDGTLDVFATQPCYPGGATSIYSRLPSGYGWAGYLGAWRNNGSANLQIGYQRGGRVAHDTTQPLSGGTATGYTALDLSAHIPPTALAISGLAYCISTSGAPACNFTLAASVNNNIGRCDFYFPSTSVGNGSGGPFRLDLVTPQTMAYFKSAGATNVSVILSGWEY